MEYKLFFYFSLSDQQNQIYHIFSSFEVYCITARYGVCTSEIQQLTINQFLTYTIWEKYKSTLRPQSGSELALVLH